MTIYTTTGSILIPSSVRSIIVKLLGEGGGRGTDSNTAGTNGSNTTFLGVSAGGGNAGAYDTAGTGGTVTNTNSNITLSIQEDGNDAVEQVGGTGNRGGDGSAGTTAPSTTPCNQVNWTGGWIYYGAGACPNDGGLQSCNNAAPAGQCGTVGCGGVVEFDTIQNRCRCPTNTCVGGLPGTAVSHYRGGGGEGAYAEFSLSSSQLDSLGYYNTSLSYSVNSNSGSGNSPENGSIEIILFFTEVYVKTSLGWQLVKNIYVNQSEVGIGWTTSTANLKNYGW